MVKAKYGLILHYQYRIPLGYSIKTQPQFPNPSQMTSSEWNRLVDGFDAEGFAEQMAQAKVGWVMIRGVIQVNATCQKVGNKWLFTHMNNFALPQL